MSRKCCGTKGLWATAIAVIVCARTTYPETTVQDRAAGILDTALAVHGGPNMVDKLQSLSIVARGTIDQSAEVQGLHPEKACIRSFEERLYYEASSRRVARQVRAPRNDLSLRWRKTVLTGNERLFVDFVSRRAARTSDADVAEERRRLLRRVPHFALEEARQRRDRLRSLETMKSGGRSYDVLALPLDTGEELSIFIDCDTGTVAKYEMQLDFPTLGNTVIEWIFHEYRRLEPLGLFPNGHTIKVGGRTYVTVFYDEVSANATLPAEAFDLPADIAPPPPPREEASTSEKSPVVEEIADGVFFVRDLSGFNTMFVELEDSVLAVEAPADYPWLEYVPALNTSPASSVGQAFVDCIKRTVPAKPIRHLVLTHHHSDHVGGTPAFIAEGAALVTTPGNRALLERMTKEARQPAPVRISRSARRPLIETFEGRRVITDGKRTVELIDIGANAHTEEMIIVWIPEERILFQGDLFYPIPVEYFPPPGREIIMRDFVNWLQDNRVSPERIYSVHGPWYGTPEHVKKLIPRR